MTADIAGTETAEPSVGIPETEASRPLEVAKRSGSDAPSMNLVILLDVSGSMKYTDPGNMATEGVMLLLDLLREDSCRVSIIAFSDTVRVLRPLSLLSMESEGEELRLLLREADRAGDTDIGLAMREAVAALKEARGSLEEEGGPEEAVGNRAEEGGSPEETGSILKEAGSSGDTASAILLFSDGSADLPEEGASDRSREEALEAALEAGRLGIPVFCAGLDDPRNDSSYHLDRDLLEHLSAESQGAFRFTQDADTLPELFGELVSDCYESRTSRLGSLSSEGDGTEDRLTFVIPDESVLEANIILLPEEEAEADLSADQARDLFFVTGPDGNNIDPEDGRARFVTSGTYSVIKLFRPATGEWTISSSGAVPCHVHVNLLFQYDISLKLETEGDANGNLLLSAAFLQDGEVLTDDLLYRQFDCRALISGLSAPESWERGAEGLIQADPEDGSSESPEAESAVGRAELPLAYNGETHRYEALLPVYPGEHLQMYAEALSESLIRSSEMCDFTSGKSDAIIVDRFPDEIRLEGFFSEDAAALVRPDTYFHAWDGSEVKVSLVSEDPSILRIDAEETNGEADTTAKPGIASEVRLQGVSSGQTAVRFRAEDGYGNTEEVSVPVTVSVTWEGLLPLFQTAALALAAAAALLLLFFFLVRPSAMSGQLLLSADPDAPWQETGPLFPLEAIGKKGTLEDLIRACPETAVPKALPSDARVLQSLMLTGPAGIHRSGVWVRCGKGPVLLRDCYGRECSRALLQDGDTFELQFADTAGQNAGRGAGTIYGCYLLNQQDKRFYNEQKAERLRV